MSTGVINKIQEFQRFGSVLGLERMEELLAGLGNPQDKLNVIHVAGTNGKGSVCQFIYEGILANNYKVGLFISPFIQRFHERIQMNGSCITDDDLTLYSNKVLAQAKVIVEQGHDSPTEFEIVTAIALLYFQDKQCDFVVLEVGLGGRGDSTNVVKKPLVSIITSISYDHMERLGDTLTKIASEKAGIIKPGVPVVSGVTEREAAKVIAKTAYERGSVLFDVTKIPVSNDKTSIDGSSFDTIIGGTTYTGVCVSMPGRHQIENAMIALTAIEILRKRGIIKVTRTKLYEGVGRAVQPGRLELISRRPVILFDGAHNEAGARVLSEAMRLYYPDQKIHMVVGMLADKEVDKMLNHFVGISRSFIATEPDNARKLGAELLAEKLIDKQVNCEIRKNPKEAYDLAVCQARPEDIIIIAGSLFLIGPLRGMLFHD